MPRAHAVVPLQSRVARRGEKIRISRCLPSAVPRADENKLRRASLVHSRGDHEAEIGGYR